MLTNTKGERKKYLMDNFIKIYPNIIPNEICEYLIDFFNHQDFVGNTHEGKSGGSVQKQIKDCTDLQINLNGKNKFDIDDIDTSKINTLNKIVDEKFVEYILSYHVGENTYQKMYDNNYNMFSDLHKVMNLMHRYKAPNQGYHWWHKDWSTMHPSYSNRMLVGMTYLNDVEEGGETEFYHQQVSVQPKKGTLVIWPAYFTHLHRGNPPISNDKYIINRWAFPKV